MNQELRVGAYARVSSLNQVYENDSSIDTQLHLINERAIRENADARHSPGKRGWKIVEEYREEGRSGKNTDRPELQRLLADVRDRKIDVVAVTKIDRITRSLLDFYQLWQAFDENGVKFVALNDSFDTTSALGMAMLNMTLVFAELERKRTSERTREKVLVRQKNGMWFGGQVPLGYKINPKNTTTLEVDEGTAEVVRKDFFERYLEVGSVRGLTRYLGKNGIKLPKRTTRRGKAAGGNPYTVGHVTRLLTNRAYIGQRKLEDGQVITCNWSPLIDAHLFDKVQEKLQANSFDRPSGRTPTEHVYLLDGLLRCGKCGTAMVRTAGKGNGGRFFYYRCGRKNRTASQGCNLKDVQAVAIENFVLSKLREYALDSESILKAVRQANEGRDEELARLEADLKDRRAALAQKTKEVNRLLDRLEGEDDAALIAPLKDRLRGRQVEATTLKDEVANLEAQRDTIRGRTLSAETVAEGYRNLTVLLDAAKEKGAQTEVAGFLQSVIDEVQWNEHATSPKEGWAEIKLFELPADFWQQRAPLGSQAGSDGEPTEGPGKPPGPSFLTGLKSSLTAHTSPESF